MFIFDLSLRVALCNIIFHSVGSVQARHLQCDTWNSPIANLGAAMNGFDPMIADPFTLPNPGYKQMIFNPLKREADGIQSLNGFIGKFEETVYCNSDLESTSIKNYNDYKTFRQSDSTFEQEMGDSNFEVLFGSGRNETTQEKEIRDLLTESGGEIIEVSQKCVTHSVAISSFVKPVFTDAFKEAMKSIHISAMDPNSRSSNETFIRFIREFGTHYMKTTLMGSKIFFQKMFAHASRTTKEERNRKKCIENSVRASLSVPVKIFELAASFIIYSAACTDSSDNQSLSLASIYSTETVTSIGALPTEGVELWATKSKESPVPISFTLDKISHLIKPEWVNDISVSHENVTIGYLNATQISDFLESKIVGYCHVMFGTNCLDHKIGCGYTRMCPAGEDCINDSSTELGYRCTPSKTGCGYDACPTGNYCINDASIMEGYKCIEVTEMCPDLEKTTWPNGVTGYVRDGGPVPTSCVAPFTDTPAGCIYLNEDGATFCDQLLACLRLGGSLWSADNRQHYEALDTYMQVYTPHIYYVGLVQPGGRWQWLGSDYTDTHWHSGQPNDPGARCAVYRSGMHDLPCSATYRGACELKL